MLNPSQAKVFVVTAVAAALSILVGLLIVESPSTLNLAILGSLLLLGLSPLLLKWHQLFLIVSWNAAVQAFFLPGQPAFWMVMAFVSLFLSILQRTVNRKIKLTTVPSIAWPLLVLGLIIFATAVARGGIGFHSFGSTMIGSRRYISVFAAIVGFFALSCQPIPRKRAGWYVGIFFLTGISAVICDLIYFAGPGVYWLYNFFPVELARAQASSEVIGTAEIYRLEGVAWAAIALFCFMVARYGVSGLLDVRKPWRFLLLALVGLTGLFGGFRSRLLWMAMLFVIQFFLEGLHRTRWMPILMGGGVLALALVVSFVDKLPFSVQRSLSFLPVKVDPLVAADASETVEWRLDMWKKLYPKIAEDFWLGEGYAFSETDLFLLEESIRNGRAGTNDMMILVGEYHSGFYSVILPFGIFGLLAFIWFLAVGWWSVYRNYRYGDPSLRIINTFLLTFFSARCIFFFAVYGSLNLELTLFTGIVGLSIGLNGGIRKKTTVQPVPAVWPARNLSRA